MSLTFEQNWKWSNKTFPHTWCVVSTWDETNHCGICLISKSSEVNISKSRKIFQICIHRSKIPSFLSIKMLFVFLKTAPAGPLSSSFTRGGGGGGGNTFFQKVKNSHLRGIFFLTSTPILVKINTGCKYFTLSE